MENNILLNLWNKKIILQMNKSQRKTKRLSKEKKKTSVWVKLPIEIKAGLESWKRFAGEEVFHGLRDLHKELLAASAEPLLTLGDQRIV